MKVFITGGLGFIGRFVTRYFLDQGDQVTAVGYRPFQDVFEHEHFDYISADTTDKGTWLDKVTDADLIINLAGKSIFKRWSHKYKKQIYDSRILTTRNLVDAMPTNREPVFCSTSATGYYGDGGEEILAEDAPHGNDFLAQVSRDWEVEALRAEKKGVRVVTTRFGIVLGQQGGILKKMIPAFKLYLGGPLGSGRQWFPWIHIDDLIAGLQFIFDHRAIQGAVNLCSPAPVRNSEFAKTLGQTLRRPAFISAPAIMLRLVMGEFGASIMYSQRVVPKKLTEHGFIFKYGEIKAALANLVST